MDFYDNQKGCAFGDLICTHCSRRFDCLLNLINHRIEHIKKRTFGYVCEFCVFIVDDNANELSEHYRAVHNIPVYDDYRLTMATTEESNNAGDVGGTNEMSDDSETMRPIADESLLEKLFRRKIYGDTDARENNTNRVISKGDTVCDMNDDVIVVEKILPKSGEKNQSKSQETLSSKKCMVVQNAGSMLKRMVIPSSSGETSPKNSEILLQCDGIPSKTGEIPAKRVEIPLNREIASIIEVIPLTTGEIPLNSGEIPAISGHLPLNESLENEQITGENVYISLQVGEIPSKSAYVPVENGEDTSKIMELKKGSNIPTGDLVNDVNVLLEVAKAHKKPRRKNNKNTGWDFPFRLKRTEVQDVETRVFYTKSTLLCLFCNFEGNTRQALVRHMNACHDLIEMYKCEYNDDDVINISDYCTKEGYVSHESPKSNRRFKCLSCHWSFLNKQGLIKHMLVHTADRLYKCHICDKNFKSPENVKQHLKIHDKAAFSCKQCDFTSTAKSAIREHRQFHCDSGIVCDNCGTVVPCKSSLMKHQRVHDATRPFACEFEGCTWRFITKLTRDSHMKSHESVGEFSCDLCGYLFRKKHHLRRHEKLVHKLDYTQQKKFPVKNSTKTSIYSSNMKNSEKSLISDPNSDSDINNSIMEQAENIIQSDNSIIILVDQSDNGDISIDQSLLELTNITNLSNNLTPLTYTVEAVPQQQEQIFTVSLANTTDLESLSESQNLVIGDLDDETHVTVSAGSVIPNTVIVDSNEQDDGDFETTQ